MLCAGLVFLIGELFLGLIVNNDVVRAYLMIFHVVIIYVGTHVLQLNYLDYKWGVNIFQIWKRIMVTFSVAIGYWLIPFFLFMASPLDIHGENTSFWSRIQLAIGLFMGMGGLAGIGRVLLLVQAMLFN